MLHTIITTGGQGVFRDLGSGLDLVVRTGATVTILAGILAEKKIEISPDEATIMCLGLYEDTGSFTFASTTQEDFKAAAFLLSKGANLNIVSNLMSREISPEQVSLLNEMIQAAKAAAEAVKSQKMQEAGAAVGKIISAGIIPAGLEMMDGPAIKAAEDFVHAGYPTDAAAILLCEVDGTNQEVSEHIAKVRELLLDFLRREHPDALPKRRVDVRSELAAAE